MFCNSNVSKSRRVRIFREHIKSGLRTKFECLIKLVVENTLGVLLLFKTSRHLIEFKLF